MISAIQPTTTIPTPRPDTAAIARNAAIQGTFNVLASVLAVRFTLLVSVIGAIGLATIAIRTALPYQLATLALYGALVVVPLVVLAARR